MEGPHKDSKINLCVYIYGVQYVFGIRGGRMCVQSIVRDIKDSESQIAPDYL